MTDPAPRDPYPADALGMDVEDMRRLAHRVVDAVIDRLENRDGLPAISTGEAADLAGQLGGAVPEHALSADQSLDLLINCALREQQHGDHPRYFARVPGPASFAAILGDWLGIGFNAMAASWAGGSGPATLELVVIDWLRQLLGLRAGTEGILTSGGSAANFTAIAAVFAQRGHGVVYLSDQTHASLIRALRTLGLSDDNLRVLPSDANFTLPLQDLEAALRADRDAGRTPLMVIANAGTTNTGAVDPLADMAALCSRESLWFHVDGAYGAPAALCEPGRNALKGLELADSLVLDPHKWLFQPYDCGCLLIRPGMLEQTFSMNPEYLRDVQADSGEVDFRNRGLELSRRARAVKLWLSFRTYGAGRFRAAIAESIALAEFAEQLLRADPTRWDIVSPAQLGIVCFALRDADAAEHQRRAQALAESGFACLSTTVLRGRCLFRLCLINPLTRRGDIEETLRRLAADPV